MNIKLNEATYPYAFFKGQIIKSEEAVVPVMAHSLQYGMGVFAGIRGFAYEKEYRIFRLKDHHTRLMNAVKILGLGIYVSYEDFEKIIHDLVRKNNPQGNFYLRPFVFSDTDQISPVIDKCTYDFSIYMIEMNEYFDKNGLDLCISSYQKYNDNAISTKAKVTGGYVNSIVAKNEAFLNGYDDCILLDDKSNVAEMSAANVLVVHNNRVLVPSVGSAILEGITLRSVVEILKNSGYDVIESTIDRSTLYAASEVIALGTAAKVKKVQSVDKRQIGDGKSAPICEFLKAEFDKVLEDKHEFSQKWLNKFSK